MTARDFPMKPYWLSALLLAVFLGAMAAPVTAQAQEPTENQQRIDDAQAFEDLEDADAFDDFEDYSSEPLVADPLYPVNYTLFYFNDFMFHNVVKPVATAYDWLVPRPPRQWVSNFFTNLLFPVRFVNNILQGKFDAAYMEMDNFIANTTWGFLGLFDVASTMKKRWEPERPTADGFGQTLGKAGIGHGIYIVWPVIGPSSIRESVGWFADAQLDPLTYGRFTLLEFAAIRSFKNVNTLSLQLTGNEYEALTEGAIDPYAAVRDAYIRYRAKKVEE